MKRGTLFAWILVLFALMCFAVFLYVNSLTFKVQKALWGKDCEAHVAVICKDKTWTFNNKKTPLMSVFKYFVALKVLDKIEREKLSLDDKIVATETMISRTTYTPMLKRYTKTPFKISVAELMKYMVSESDNNATDILLSYVGGISEVQKYLNILGFNDIGLFADEKMMEADIQNQYLNKATPLDVISLMKTVREGKILSTDREEFLDNILIETTTGEDKIKAGLPKGTIFGHKTGMSSRKPDGVRIAENDAGFVILPDGKTYYIAVFVTESKMSDSENHALAAQVSEIVYEHIMALK